MARLASSSVTRKSSIEQLENDIKQQQRNIELGKKDKQAKTAGTTIKKAKELSKLHENVMQKSGVSFEESDEEIKDVSEAYKIFGRGFTPDEYTQMVDIYNTYLPSYPLKTANHKMALIKVCKCTMRYNQALADNDIESIKLWDSALSKALKEAKINPEQLDSADLTEGITSISQLVMAVEKVKEPIGILPHLISNPQDGADYILWQFINYSRKVKNLPLCSYADVYEFMNEQYEANKDTLPFLVRNVNGKYDSIEDDI